MPLQRTQRAIKVLRAVNKALESATDEQQLLEDVCRIVTGVGGYMFAWVGYAHDDESKSVQFMAHAGHHSEYLQKIRISWDEDTPSGRGPAGVAIRSLRPVIIQNIGNSANFAPWEAVAAEYGYRSVIALPLGWHEKTIGCLAILSTEADAFDEQEAGLLHELSSSLSYGISALRTRAAHEQALAELRAERDIQSVLRNILTLSLEAISLEQKLDRTLELLFDVPWLTLERKGCVFLVDDSGTKLKLASRQHLSPVLHELCAEVPFGHCLCGIAAEKNELVFQSHVNVNHTTRFDGIKDHGHYCQPIRSADKLLGVLNLYVSADHRYNDTEARFLETVADTLAGVIEREQSAMMEQRLITLLEATPDLVSITDTEGNCLYCNASAKSILKIDNQRRDCNENLLDLYPSHTGRHLREEAFPKASEAGLWEGELMLETETGEPLPASILVMGHRDSNGEVAYLSTTARDIRDRIQAEEAAEAVAVREQNFANILINSLPGIFYLIDEGGRLIRWNSNMEKLLGYSSKELRNQAIGTLIGEKDWEKMDELCERIVNLGSASDELDFLCSDGQSIPFYITGTLVAHNRTGRSIVGIGIDISYRRQLEQELRTRAITDALTGTFNRLKMEEALEQELKRSERYGTPLSIAMFDIDHFKRVNDTYGHDVGDVVLKSVAAIVRDQLRDVDLLARWGGEEFMIISAETSLESMQILTERIRAAIEKHPVNGQVRVTASFGIGQYVSGESQKQLLKRIDDALYQAKNSGRNRVETAQ